MATECVDLELSASIDGHLIRDEFADAFNDLQINIAQLQQNCSDVVATIVKHLTDANFCHHPDRYVTCENLLKSVAEKAKEEDALFEFLEIVETTKSDNVFISTLKALQIVIRRQKDRKVRSLEWCLNSILTYISELPFPDDVKNCTEADAEHLFEDNDEVRRVLTNYLTLFLFYEPFLADILAARKNASIEWQTFQRGEFTRPSVLGSFLLQLFNAPFYCLNLTKPNEKSCTNTYSWQCATTIVRHWTSVCPNPFFLLEYVERRKRWPSRHENKDPSLPIDIYLVEEKTPMHPIGVLFYLLYAEDLMPSSAPNVYTPLYIFESVLYLATDMLETKIHGLHYKALQMCLILLNRLGDPIPSDSLDLAIHETFSQQLIRVITQSPAKRNSQLGGQVLRKYIYAFSDNGSVFLISNFLRTVDHNGLFAYISAMYKDLVAAALRNTEEKRLSEHYSGDRLRTLLLDYICRLPNGIETDLLRHSDQMITSLNIVRFLALSDTSNRTGFWDLNAELSDKFLQPLHKAIEVTKSHYRLEERRVLEGKDVEDVEVGVQLTNGEAMPALDRNAKLKLFKSALNTFDLMESLAYRVEECVRALPKD